MQQGKIEQVASPPELYESPTTQFSASFIAHRNALELPIQNGRIQLGTMVDIPAPELLDKQRALVLFRPEDVEFSSNGRGQPAIVEGKMFQGVFTRLQLMIQFDHGTERIYADLPSRQAAHLNSGSVVRIYINPTHAKIFPADHNEYH